MEVWIEWGKRGILFESSVRELLIFPVNSHASVWLSADALAPEVMALGNQVLETAYVGTARGEFHYLLSAYYLFYGRIRFTESRLKRSWFSLVIRRIDTAD
jgi:hypothetical protein